MATLNELHFLSLYLGGVDGGVYKAASAAVTGKEIHLIEVLADDATFTVLSAVDQNGDAVDMAAAGTNNLGARTYMAGDLVYAPHGGYITAYTVDKASQYYQMPSSLRTKQES